MTGTPDKDRKTLAVGLTLAGVLGQVGCLTLVIIALAIVAGLWIDNRFQTGPLFTLLFVIGSIPITLFLMFRIVLSVAPKIQSSVGWLAGVNQTNGEGEPNGE
jgi:hypothetical protein